MCITLYSSNPLYMLVCIAERPSDRALVSHAPAGYVLAGRCPGEPRSGEGAQRVRSGKVCSNGRAPSHLPPTSVCCSLYA